MSRAKSLKIDFFCIGAAKSGTTWLYHSMAEHPNVTLSKNKEPNFFVRKLSAFSNVENPRFMEDWEWYTALFDHRKAGDILGEFSINLLHNTADAPLIIREHFPAAKFIVMLRDPVARTYSHYWHERRYDLISGVPDSFEKALNNEELLFRSRYYDQLKVWLGIFPKERFYFIYDFELSSDLLPILSSLFHFLNVDPDFRPSTLCARINPATKRHRLLVVSSDAAGWARNHGLGFLIAVLKQIGLARLARRLLIRPVDYPPMDPNTERWLRQYFLTDIERLEQLVGKQLDAWKA